MESLHSVQSFRILRFSEGLHKDLSFHLADSSESKVLIQELRSFGTICELYGSRLNQMIYNINSEQLYAMKHNAEDLSQKTVNYLSIGMIGPTWLMEYRNWNVIQKLKNLDESEFDFAVLILNQSILCEPEMITSLWKKAAFRILVDGGSNHWINFLKGLKMQDSELPDFISGDFDSITAETREYFESRKVEMNFTPDQDETDFLKALRCAANAFETKGLDIKLIIAVCENSGRFDQIMANISTLHHSDQILQGIPIIILTSESITWILHPGKHAVFVPREFIEKQYACGLIPLSGPTLVTTNGLKWNLKNFVMKMEGLISTSNTYTSTEINVTCDRPLMWTTQYC